MWQTSLAGGTTGLASRIGSMVSGLQETHVSLSTHTMSARTFHRHLNASTTATTAAASSRRSRRRRNLGLGNHSSILETNSRLTIMYSRDDRKADDRELDVVAPKENRKRIEEQQPSAELQELVKVQLDMLVSILETRIGDDTSGHHDDVGIRCAMYCRTPESITSRTLKLQLVATSDDGWDASTDTSRVFANECIIGDESISADAEEAWVVNQPMIVLPDNGGLILPLTHKSQFLVGLLLVERTLPKGSATGTHILPPVHDVFGPAEIGIIKQSGVALSMSCAMDLRAVMERAGTRMQQERMQGLLEQASMPLRTLKTLGRMLQPRLSQGEPERDMTDSIVAQGQYLGDVMSQLQSVIGKHNQVAPSDSGDGVEMRTKRQSFLPAEMNVQNRVVRSKRDNKRQSSYPALPSSSIGADNWDTLSLSSSHDDDENDENSTGSTLTDPTTRDDEKEEDESSQTVFSHISGPLFDAAQRFSSVKGVTLAIEDRDQVLSAQIEILLKAPFSIAKHIYSILIDASLSHVGTGDTIWVQIGISTWEGHPGVLMELSTSRPCLGDDNKGGVIVSPALPLGMELEALQRDVADLSGWLQIQGDMYHQTMQHGEDDNQHILCALWLPLHSHID